MVALSRRSLPFLSFLCLGGLFLPWRVWNVDQNLLKSTYSQQGKLKRSKVQLVGVEPVHLMYASDDHSLLGVEASIQSVMKHASEPIIFHYVGDSPLTSFPEVNFYSLQKVAKKYKLKEFTNPRERSKNGYQGINENLANYARFAMDSLLPDQSKAMWIDVDTVVLCDVVPLVRNAFTKSNHTIAAVPAERSPRGFADGILKQYGVEIGFNAGVYIVQLDRWRSENMTEKIRNIALKNRKKRLYKLGSQAPLILATEDKFEHLPHRWNTKVSSIDKPERQANEQDACLLHWSGPNKPWDKDGFHKDLWEPYARRNGSNIS